MEARAHSTIANCYLPGRGRDRSFSALWRALQTQLMQELKSAAGDAFSLCARLFLMYACVGSLLFHAGYVPINASIKLKGHHNSPRTPSFVYPHCCMIYFTRNHFG